MGNELAALGVWQRRGHRDLDAELVGPVRLALADALHLRRMQRIDLRSTLVLFLLKHPSRQRQHAQKDTLTKHGVLTKRGVAFDLAGDVADDTAEIGSKRLQGPVGALELLGVGVALMPDQCKLAHPCIGLA
jgi:hypothetical protein